MDFYAKAFRNLLISLLKHYYTIFVMHLLQEKVVYVSTPHKILIKVISANVAVPISSAKCNSCAAEVTWKVVPFVSVLRWDNGHSYNGTEQVPPPSVIWCLLADFRSGQWQIRYVSGSSRIGSVTIPWERSVHFGIGGNLLNFNCPMPFSCHQNRK